MRAGLASAATGGCLSSCRPTVPSTFRPRLARLAPSTPPVPPCPSLTHSQSGLRRLSPSLTPRARRSPGSLTSCTPAGGQRSRSQPAALRPGWGSAALPRGPSAPWRGDPLHHAVAPTCLHVPTLATCSCRVARHGGPLRGEVNRRLHKSRKQTTASPVLDVCLRAPKPGHCSRLEQHRCYAHQTGTQTFIPETPTTSQIKSAGSFHSHKATHFSAVHKHFIPYTLLIRRNSHTLCTAQQSVPHFQYLLGYTPLVVLSLSPPFPSSSGSQSVFCSTAQAMPTGLPCNLR